MRDQDLWNLNHLKWMVCSALWRSLSHPIDCKLLPTYRTQNMYIQVDVYILAAEAKCGVCILCMEMFPLNSTSTQQFLIEIRIWRHTLLHIKQDPNSSYT